jgi:hypothetical protein
VKRMNLNMHEPLAGRIHDEPTPAMMTPTALSALSHTGPPLSAKAAGFVAFHTTSSALQLRSTHRRFDALSSMRWRRR